VPKPIADYNLLVPVLLCYRRLNTHHFYLFFSFIRKKYTCHKTGSASVHVRKKSCGSGSVD